MSPGAHDAARWVRPGPRRVLPATLVERMAQTGIPGCRVVATEHLSNGFRNANFKIQLDCPPEFIVLRVYEHDASLCQKETDLMRLVRASVPVPEVLHSAPRVSDDLPPYVLLSYVEGVNLAELKLNKDASAIAQAAYSAGETLAAIGHFSFLTSGWLAAGPTVTVPLLEGADPLPRFVNLCLASEHLQKRVRPQLRERAHALMWAWARRLAATEDDARLVHCDFGKRNLLVGSSAGKWSVAAVLDWEFAVAGSPLIDLGHFLRYERAAHPVLEPYFSRGYVDRGGKLPQDWRQLSRLFDLTALCESLTREQLTDDVEAELVELVTATAENRDPQVP